jgi:integrase
MGDHLSSRQGRPPPDGGGPIWIKQAIDTWITAAKIEKGRLLRPLSKSGKMVGDELGDWAIWSVVELSSKQIGIEHFGAHDLRRTCAKLCRKNGGGMEQIKFLLSHSLIQNYGALPRFRTGNLRGHE